MNNNIKFNNKKLNLKKKLCAICITISVLFIIVGSLIICLYWQYHSNKIQRQQETDYLKNLVEKINQATDVRWKAKFNPYGMKKRAFDYKSLRNITAVKDYIDKIENFFKSDLMIHHLKELELFETKKLPMFFDAREKWSLCSSLHHVPNQNGCGSCYAVAAMAVASDRTCIHSNYTFNIELSAADVLGCCAVCGNCYGGDPIKALTYWATEGVVSGGNDGCRPYSIKTKCGTPCSPEEYPKSEENRKCYNYCQQFYYKNSYKNDKHYGSLVYTLYPRKITVDQASKNRVTLSSIIGHFNKTSKKGLSLTETRNIIQKELYLFGPTTFALPITEEFLHYDSGVFHPYPEKEFSKRIIYWHVVRLIGWGYDKNDKFYWIAINSFGTEWGENGLFRIDPTLLEEFGLEYETGLP